MALKFLSKTRLTAADLFSQSFQYLVDTYEQSTNLLTPASPFTQILMVVSEIGELIFYYMQKIANEMNIKTARNRDAIYGHAIIAGHNPTRAISATGLISIRLKPTSTAFETAGTFFLIPKYTKMLCLNNNLQYLLIPESDNIRIEKGSTSSYNVKIIQGTVDSQIFTAQGAPNESVNVSIKEMTDNFWVNVYVNGEKWDNYDTIYDMNYNTKGCVIKTGINGGIGVYFGSGSFGKIPASGSSIKVDYLKTNGTLGNIGVINDTTLSFLDTGFTKYGEEIDLNDNLFVTVIEPPTLGSDAESIEFTRLIAPHASKSFVLANPENYYYFLSKYNYFSIIDAYNTFDDEYLDDDNIVYLFLLPDVSKKISIDTDYFSLDESAFTMTEAEKNKIHSVIDRSGQQCLTSDISFVDPIIKRYALSIVLRYFDSVDKETIVSDIRIKLSDYFLNIRRRDKIPRSDLIAIIEAVEGVDSVNLYFISQDNEEAIANGYYYKKIYGYDRESNMREVLQTKQIYLTAGENPNLGLDEFGDIIIGDKEVPIIRGGWSDRVGNYYEIYPTIDKLSSLNIVFKEKIGYDVYNKIMDNRRKSL